MTEIISRHEAKIVILTLLIQAIQVWTFDDPRIPKPDQDVLRSVRDEQVKQLESNLTFARNANRK